MLPACWSLLVEPPLGLTLSKSGSPLVRFRDYVATRTPAAGLKSRSSRGGVKFESHFWQ
jgi:hypothetical protein